MADYINHISESDLAIISGGPRKSKTDRRMGFFEDFAFGLVYLIFCPLVYVTLFPEVRMDILGLGQDAMTVRMFWSMALLTGFMIFKEITRDRFGPFTRICTRICVLLSIPLIVVAAPALFLGIFLLL